MDKDSTSPNSSSLNDKKREIRSFVVRSSRMTASQQIAFDGLFEKWGIDVNGGTLDFSALFNNDHPTHLEIGFGMGDSLATMAEQNPQTNYIGIEVHAPGIGRLLSLVEKKAIDNIRVIQADAVSVLKNNIRDNSLARVNIFFPDPWHKTKHRKRRLIQTDFINLLHSRLQAKGLFHFATDWLPYAHHVSKLMTNNPHFENVMGADKFAAATQFGRPETKFERRGIKLGHEVRDLVFSRI